MPKLLRAKARARKSAQRASSLKARLIGTAAQITGTSKTSKDFYKKDFPKMQKLYNKKGAGGLVKSVRRARGWK